MKFNTAYLDSIFESPLEYKRLIDRIADQMVALKKKNSFTNKNVAVVLSGSGVGIDTIRKIIGK